jgi:hypothetical protein
MDAAVRSSTRRERKVRTSTDRMARLDRVEARLSPVKCAGPQLVPKNDQKGRFRLL